MEYNSQTLGNVAAAEEILPEYIEECSTCSCCNGFVYECEGEMCATLGVCECFADKEYAGDDPVSPTLISSSGDEQLMMEAFNASLASLLRTTGASGNDKPLLAAMQQQVLSYQRQNQPHKKQQQQQQQQHQFGGGFRGGRGRFAGRGGGGGGGGGYNEYLQHQQRADKQGDVTVNQLTTASRTQYTHIHRSGQPLHREFSKGSSDIGSSESSSLQHSGLFQQRSSSVISTISHVGVGSGDISGISGVIGGANGSNFTQSSLLVPQKAITAVTQSGSNFIQSPSFVPQKAITAVIQSDSTGILASKISAGLDNSKVVVQRGPVGAVFIEDKAAVESKKVSRRRNKNKESEGVTETVTSLTDVCVEDKGKLLDCQGNDSQSISKNGAVSLASSIIPSAVEITEEQRLKKDLRNAEKRLRTALDLQISAQVSGSNLDDFQKSKVEQIPEMETTVRDIKEKLAAL